MATDTSWIDHATAVGGSAGRGGGLSATRSRTACSPCSGGLSSPGCW